LPEETEENHGDRIEREWLTTQQRVRLCAVSFPLVIDVEFEMSSEKCGMLPPRTAGRAAEHREHQHRQSASLFTVKDGMFLAEEGEMIEGFAFDETLFEPIREGPIVI
jgi:hypothetical protein